MYSTSRLSVAADHDPTPDTDGEFIRALYAARISLFS